MNKLFLITHILILFEIVSCSTTSTDTAKLENETEYEEGEFDWIKNEDFNQPLEISYQKERDKYPDRVTEGNALALESLARLPAQKLENLQESDGPIAQITKLCYTKKFEEATALMDRHYAQYKNNPEYWNQVGSCYYLQGDLKKSTLFYNKAKNIDETYSPAINNLGVIYSRKGEYQKALSAFKRSLELSPFSLTPQFNISQMYMRFGLLDNAQKILNLLLNTSKQDVDIISSLGSLNLIKGDYEQSISYFRMLDAKVISRFDIGTNYAIALNIIGEKDKAKNLFSKVSNDDLPNDMQSYYYKVKEFIGF